MCCMNEHEHDITELLQIQYEALEIACELIIRPRSHVKMYHDAPDAKQPSDPWIPGTIC